MNAFEAYRTYLALRMHFTQSEYNYFQYAGKVRANVSSFEKRNDIYAFKKLAKHKDLEGLIVSNFINRLLSARELVTQSAEQTYKDWLHRRQSLTYVYTEEIKKLRDNIKENFILPKDDLPHVLKLFMSKKISYETFIILLYNTGTIDYYDKKLKDNTLWVDLSFKVKKYRHFLNYDRKKTIEITKEHFCITN